MIAHKYKNASGPRSHAMARQLVLRGHKVTQVIIAEKKKTGFNEYDWDGVHIVETPDLLWGKMRSGWDPWSVLNRINYFRKDHEPYNLIHCFETRPATIYPALYLQHKRKIPLITDWNDWWGHHGLIDVNRPFLYRLLFGWIETYYEEAFRSNAAGLSVIAKGLETRAIGLGVNPDRICHIPGGASLEFFPIRSAEESRRLSNLPLTDPVLGFCSADSHLDMEIVMASLVHVIKKYPKTKLIITGKVKKDVHKLVDTFNVSDHIIFTGFLPKETYASFLGSADVFLLPMDDKPYNHGRWPNKMGDYLSLGRPTVSNPIGDIKTLFEKYPVGLLAEWDAQDFADKIIYLLEHPNERQTLGEKARWVAENEYSWNNLGDRLESFYMKILAMQTSNGKFSMLSENM
jgi:glycosyltransferase involved in cell wall biosynthesis